MPGTAQKPTKPKTGKVRTAVYLSSEVHRDLWLERISGQKTISDLVDSIVRTHYARKAGARRSA